MTHPAEMLRIARLYVADAPVPGPDATPQFFEQIGQFIGFGLDTVFGRKLLAGDRFQPGKI